MNTEKSWKCFDTDNQRLSASPKYRLIGTDGKEYVSAAKGLYGGHRKLKIYGRLDCPSALRQIAKGNYIPYRVFFADEESALAAGYRPCGICMKEHYQLWKEGRLMLHALDVQPILNRGEICIVRLADGKEKSLTADRLKGTSIPEKLEEIEYYQMNISGDYCLIVLTANSGQWGYTIVWDYVSDRIVHLSSTPFVVCSAILGARLVNLYLVQYWGHPADFWYSTAPLELVDGDYEPERYPLELSLEGLRKGPDDCGIDIVNEKLHFRAGQQEICIENLPD